jgi:opacity protein-like surface antigen
MKNISRSWVLVAGCGLGLFVWPGVGHSQHFYVNADAGVSFAEDVNLRQFVVRTPGAKVKLEPGGRLSAAGGYNFNDYIGAQIETGLIYNEVKSVTGARHVDASLGHVPLLADVVLRYDKPDCKWVPYAGAGAGGDISVIDLDDVRAPNGSIVDGAGSAAVFAWQAFAGLRYKLNDKMSIGGGYKFFSAGSPTWDVRHTAGDIKAGTARVHSAGVDFNMTF